MLASPQKSIGIKNWSTHTGRQGLTSRLTKEKNYSKMLPIGRSVANGKKNKTEKYIYIYVLNFSFILKCHIL